MLSLLLAVIFMGKARYCSTHAAISQLEEERATMTLNFSRSLLPRLLGTTIHSASTSTMGVRPLEGVKVVELAGLAPVPFCGLVLADFGAQVTVIKKGGDELLEQRMTRGKRQKVVNLKSAEGLKEVREMCLTHDVLLDPYRPGVLEKMGLDPVDLIKHNKKLIVARITGYGQTGEMAPRAGHDINYVSLTGMQPTIAGHSPHRLPYWPPANLLADFAGGGLSAAFGVAAALYHRHQNGGIGGVIDVSMVEGLAYLSTFITAYKDVDVMWNKPYAWFSGDSPIYRTYRTADDKYMAVGALEPKFTNTLFETLKLTSTITDLLERPQEVTKEMERVFKSKTRAEWTKVFSGVDACVTPVLEMHEVGDLKHHQQRGCFIHDGNKFWGGPAPKIYTAEQFSASLNANNAKQ
ncbi:CaiB/baiF CoA-transferase family protein [Toxocara canis]|uniref:CaiB/baiF CoA-transferase family protein n=1 Tax=Toxocara canis TaxID=6265 RepID=A0A0B2UXH2_TOXCA|nr:CaiB/baiF CoA-transferase family protein [Toxocara canis]